MACTCHLLQKLINSGFLGNYSTSVFSKNLEIIYNCYKLLKLSMLSSISSLKEKFVSCCKRRKFLYEAIKKSYLMLFKCGSDSDIMPLIHQF